VGYSIGLLGNEGGVLICMDILGMWSLGIRTWVDGESRSSADHDALEKVHNKGEDVA
jgi:hypothetical protein